MSVEEAIEDIERFLNESCPIIVADGMGFKTWKKYIEFNRQRNKEREQELEDICCNKKRGDA